MQDGSCANSTSGGSQDEAHNACPSGNRNCGDPDFWFLAVSIELLLQTTGPDVVVALLTAQLYTLCPDLLQTGADLL